jgi:hypothetical protein
MLLPPILLTKLPLAMEAWQAARVSLSLEVAATVVKDKPAGLFHPQGGKNEGQEKGDSYMCTVYNMFDTTTQLVCIYPIYPRLASFRFLYLFISSRKLQF